MYVGYIRMSSKEQSNGDSARRQREAINEYAKSHDIPAHEIEIIEDIGVSAFKGGNVEFGQLGKFIDRIEAGTIPAGSTLLVEALDRLSREKMLGSMGTFLRILKAEINIVTLSDNVTHNHMTFGKMQAFADLMHMGKANEESELKSQRVGKAWASMRGNARATGKPMTRCAVGWLSLAEDRSHFILNEERAEIIRAMFRDCINGMGAHSIMRRLNQAGVPPWRGGKGWQESFIKKTLHNEATFGVFQPHRKVDRIRIPDGEPIQGYYPPVITEDEFLLAQRALASRKVRGGGRKGSGLSNLFSRLAICGHCSGPMLYRNSGKKGRPKLVCDNAYRRLGCNTEAWNYADFEGAVLTSLRDVDFASLLDTEDDALQLAQAENIHAVEQQVLIKHERDRETLFDLLLEQPSDFLKKKLRSCETAIQIQRGKIGCAKAALNDLRAIRDLSSSRVGIPDIIQKLQAGGDDAFATRCAVQQRLREAIKNIHVFPLAHHSGSTGRATSRSGLGTAKCFVLEYAHDRRVAVMPSPDATGAACRETILFSFTSADGPVWKVLDCSECIHEDATATSRSLREAIAETLENVAKHGLGGALYGPTISRTLSMEDTYVS